MSTKIAINGAAGRMGRTLIETIANNSQLSLGAAFEHAESSFLATDAGQMAGIGIQNVSIGSSLEQAIADFEVLIDFTVPDSTLAALEVCLKHGKKMVIGTTGFDEEQQQQIKTAATQIPIVMASNFSVGVNLSFKLLEIAAAVIGNDADIEIIEAHHRHKIDAPSGTALSMGKVIAEVLNRDLDSCAVYGREGQIGARQQDTIGFATVRGGDIIGDHTALFAADGERIEITHKASSRATFATGAVRSAAWLADKQAGLYNMQDVLGFSKSVGA